MDYLIGTLLMLVIVGGLVWSWTDMSRRPEIWRNRLSEQRWARVGWYVTATWLAAALGALLAGRPDVAGAVMALGAVLSLLVFRVWTMARTFSRDP